MSDFPFPAFAIRRLEYWPAELEIDGGFAISQIKLETARNIFVRVTLPSGEQGYGEIAPFPGLTRETREESLAALPGLAEILLRHSPSALETWGERLAAAAPDRPATRAGIETALLDALARAARQPLWKIWGGKKESGLETDVTIPILPLADTLAAAQRWVQRGFRVLKIKIGHDPEEDSHKVLTLAQRHPRILFLLDANQGYDRPAAFRLVQAIRPIASRLTLLEQPLPKDDLAGLAELQERLPYPVAADESVARLSDLEKLIAARAARAVNIKIMKSGVLEALAIARRAKAAGLCLMIGGMMETRLAMACSLALAAGRGTIEHLDLDTPLLLRHDPWQGGYRYDGPRLLLSKGPGLDLTPRRPGVGITCFG